MYEGKSFKYDLCVASFKEKSSLKRHTATVHDEKNPFHCNICDTSFQQGNLKKHISSVHKGKKHLKCEVCDATFSCKAKLRRHTESVHEKKTPFRYNICDTYFRSNIVKQHIASVHGGNEQ